MKNTNTPKYLLLLTALFSLVLARVASAESTNAWTATNGISANLFWSSPPNWSRGAAPVTSDDIIFNDGGATLSGSVLSVNGGSTNAFSPANITSIVDANRTVHWLYMCPTNTTGGWQNLFITNGVTLTVQGTEDNGMGPFGDFDNPSGSATVSILNSLETMYVGRKLGANVSALAANPTLVSISGEGTLFLNNTNNQMQVRDANSTSGAHTAVLDMSALATFQANLGRIKVGMGEQNSTNLRAAGNLFLARTNYLVLSGPIYTNFFAPAPATNLGVAELANLVVGLNPQNAGNASTLYLGWSNGIYADYILIGGRKSGGGNMIFNPTFTNPTYTNTQSTPTAFFRGSKGGLMSYFCVGDEIVGGSGTACSGTMDLTGGLVDIGVDNMIIGRAQVNGGADTAILRVGEGDVKVNNVEFATQGSASVGSAVTSTINLVGTKMTVTNSLKMVSAFKRSVARTLNFGMSSDANGVPASMTTLGSVSSGFIDTALTQDSTINEALTNSTFSMVNPQPFAASTLVLDNGSISNASYILITGYGASAAVNNGYGSAMTIVNGGNIVGTPILDLGARPTTPPTWDVSGIGGAIPGTLVVSNLLEGVGTIQGSVSQAPGATIQAGEGAVAGTLTIASGGINAGAGNLTLNTNGNLQFGLSSSGTSGNDSIAVQGTLTLLGTNNVTLSALGGSFDTANPYTLITSGSALPAGAANFFKASGALGGSRYILTFDTTASPNNVLLHVSGTGPSTDTWAGGQNGNAWDVKTTANFSSGQFFDLDNVIFNDSGSASPAVNTVGALIPGSMTVGTTNNNYGFGGTGSILIGGAFTASGRGGITFTNSGGVAFQDGLTIASNAVTLGGSGSFSVNGDPNTQAGLTLNGGSMALTGNSTLTLVNPVSPQAWIVNDGAISIVNSNANVFNGSTISLVNPDAVLVFGQPATVSAACDASFGGAGVLMQNGPGALALSGVNGLSTPTIVNGGILQILAATALGGGAVVNSGGTLDVFGTSISVPVTIAGSGSGGQGALVSNSGTGGAIHNGLTLTTNASIGGTPPWSFDPVQNVGLFNLSGTLLASYTNASGGTNGYNLTKVGANEVQWAFSPGDPALGNIDVQSGMLYLQGTSGLGNPTNNITVEAGATVAFAAFTDGGNASGIPTKNWILNGDGSASTLLDYAITATTIAGPVTLNGNVVFGVAPDSRVNNGNSGTPGGFEIQGPISGTGSISKSGDDTVTLDATNIYTGNTIVSGGTLKLQGQGSISSSSLISIQNGATVDTTARNDLNLNLGNGQTLSTLNNGYINGNLATTNGSTLAPGGASSLDVLTVIGNVTLSGTTSMKLDALLSTNDVIAATNGGNNIQYGGTLNLTTSEGTYAIGQTYFLFSATTYGGSFSSIAPAQPGSGLAWDTSRLSIDGSIKIATGSVVTGPTTNATITSVKLSGGNLTIHGTNNNVPNNSGHFVVLTSTNVATPLNNWTPVVTNSYNNDGTFDYSSPIAPGSARQFIDIKAAP